MSKRSSVSTTDTDTGDHRSSPYVARESKLEGVPGEFSSHEQARFVVILRVSPVRAKWTGWDALFLDRCKL